MTQIQYRLSNLLDFQILPQYTKPNNPNFEELEASYNAWIDAAEFLSAPHKQVRCIKNHSFRDLINIHTRRGRKQSSLC